MKIEAEQGTYGRITHTDHHILTKKPIFYFIIHLEI